MLKFPLTVALTACFLMSGCNRSSESDATIGKIYYSYGTEALPGNLTPLDVSYRPQHLSQKVYSLAGTPYAPMDISEQNLTLTFDISAQSAVGHSILKFQTSQLARPLFQLVATVTNARLDGVAVTTSLVTDPDGQDQNYVSVEQEVAPGITHELEFDYVMNASQVTFTSGGVRVLTDMSDLYPAHFFELIGPAGFEDDAFSLTLNLKVLNGTSTQELFTNGTAASIGANDWTITFPSYFTSSSIYFHFTNRTDLTVNHFIYGGSEKNIPVTVYSTSSSLVNKASQLLPLYFAEYERDFGPFAHDQYVAYIHSSGGGMEYSGATITSISALDHELLHSWFARSVMPAEGRSGWIDEAFASWHDYGYFQSPSLLSRLPTNLSSFSPFRKSTPDNCYHDGRHLISELDRNFAQFGGMRPLMKLLFERYKNRVITNEEFWQFLSVKTQMNIDAFFQRYTLGGASATFTSLAQTPKALLPKVSVPLENTNLDFATPLAITPLDFAADLPSRHPEALTASEVKTLR